MSKVCIIAKKDKGLFPFKSSLLEFVFIERRNLIKQGANKVIKERLGWQEPFDILVVKPTEYKEEDEQGIIK